MKHQDWNTITLKKKQEPSTLTKDQKNTFSGKTGGVRILKDEQGEEYVAKKTKTYTLEFRNRMQEARKNKSLSQKDLATKLNVKQSQISEIESGKAEWDGQLVVKIEKILGSLRK